MTATYYDEDEQEQEVTLDSREIVEYAPQIISALQSECRWLKDEGPEAAERGLMVYFDGPDSVEQKVQSYFFNAEVREGRLGGGAECKVRGELTPLELQHLTDDIGGQASDGVGESFEQREIQVDGYLGIHILAFLLTLFTLGIGSAWASTMILKWEAKHTHIGGGSLEFDGTGGQLFVKCLLLVILTPLTLGIYALFFPVSYTKWRVKHTDVNGRSMGKENQNVPKTMAPESSGGKVLIPIFSVAAVVLAAVLIFSGLFGRTPVSDAPVSDVRRTEPPAEETADSPDDKRLYQNSGFVFPDSGTELILPQELESLSDSDLTYAINEIYAQHGYIFRNDELREYYGQFSWYVGEIPADEFSADCFNQIERQNWNLLVNERNLRKSTD